MYIVHVSFTLLKFVCKKGKYILEAQLLFKYLDMKDSLHPSVLQSWDVSYFGHILVVCRLIWMFFTVLLPRI